MWNLIAGSFTNNVLFRSFVIRCCTMKRVTGSWVRYHSSHSSAFSSRYFLNFSKELVRLYCIVLLDVLNSSAISVSFIPSK